MKQDKKVTYDSDEAAKEKTVTGWVSRDGLFWGKDEHMARWSGCTHKKCECGNEMEKSWTKCKSCRDKSALERWQAKPFEPYTEQPVYDEASGEYFFTECDIRDHLHWEEKTEKDLMLTVCTPTHMRQVEDDYWCDDLAEDMYLDDIAPKEILEALENLNKLIRDKSPVLSWYPGKSRTELPPEAPTLTETPADTGATETTGDTA